MTAPKKLKDAVGSRTAPYASPVLRGSPKVAPAAWVTPRQSRGPDLPWSLIETVGKPQAGESPLPRALRRLPSCVPLIPRGPFAAVSFPWRPEDERTCLTIFHNCLRGAGGSLPLQAGVWGGEERETRERLRAEGTVRRRQLPGTARVGGG